VLARRAVRRPSNITFLPMERGVGRLGPMPSQTPYAWKYLRTSSSFDVLTNVSPLHTYKRRILSKEEYEIWRIGKILRRHLIVTVEGDKIQIRHLLFDEFYISIPLKVWKTISGGSLLVEGQCFDISKNESVQEFHKYDKQTRQGINTCNVDENLDLYFRFIEKVQRVKTLKPKSRKRKLSLSPNVDGLFLSGQIPLLDPRKETLLVELNKQDVIVELNSYLPMDVIQIVIEYAWEELPQLDYENPQNHKCQFLIQHDPKSGTLRVDCRYHPPMYLEMNLYSFIRINL
jgi:hypothetical protein